MKSIPSGQAAGIDAEAIDIVVVIADDARPSDGSRRRCPPVFVKTYLQAHRLDTEFYDTRHAAGGYLRTHAEHDRNWS